MRTGHGLTAAAPVGGAEKRQPDGMVPPLAD
jgi:hypothetical protein